MKKIVSYMMTGILLLSFLLTGCGSPEPQTGKKMSMYYINTAETKVEVHEQYLNTKTLDEQLDETMRYLSTTPEKLEYRQGVFGTVSHHGGAGACGHRKNAYAAAQCEVCGHYRRGQPVVR